MAAEPGEVLQSALPEVRTVRPWARATALSAYVVLLTLWTRRFGVPSDAVQIFAWLWLATIAWNIEAPIRQHLGFVRDWWVPLVLLVFYFYSRGLADEFGFTPHITMPIVVDEWLFGGELPSYTLQAAWCGSPCDPNSAPAWYDVFFTSVYTTHFLFGLTIAMVLWLTNRVEWRRWMRRYVGANFAALVVYVLYPMAPPWMASDEGYLSQEVQRITHRGWADTDLGRFHLVLTGVGNPVAAMPSLHAGVAFLIALYGIQRLRTTWRWLLVAYPVAMSVGLVYYGEHYVVDIIAGVALAGLVMALCSFWERTRGD